VTWRLGLCALLMLLAPSVMEAQSSAPELRVTRDTIKDRPLVQSTNLLGDTPWLTALRQGLPVRLRYRVEIWRSREGWFDAIANQYEWQVVIRHQPLLDQFTLYRLFPRQSVRTYTYATSGALAAVLEQPYAIPLKPTEDGIHYYAASLDVQTLSDSDLDDFNKVIRGEIVQGSGGSLAERARRLALQLAGLPKLNLTARSAQFEYKR
jgi:hypothetical protein